MAPTNTPLTAAEQKKVQTELDAFWDAKQEELDPDDLQNSKISAVNFDHVQQIYQAVKGGITDAEILADVADKNGAFNASIKDIVNNNDKEGRDDIKAERKVKDYAKIVQGELRELAEQSEIAAKIVEKKEGSLGSDDLTALMDSITALEEGGVDVEVLRNRLDKEDQVNATKAPAAEPRPEPPAIDQAITIPDGYWTDDGRGDTERHDFTFENIEALLNDPTITNRRQTVTVTNEDGEQEQKRITDVTVADVYLLLKSDSELIASIGQGEGGEQRLEAAERMVAALDTASRRELRDREESTAELDLAINNLADKMFLEREGREFNWDPDDMTRHNQLLDEARIELTRAERLALMAELNIDRGDKGLTAFLEKRLHNDEILETRVRVEKTELLSPEAAKQALEAKLPEGVAKQRGADVLTLQGKVTEALDDMLIGEILREAENDNRLDPNGPVTSQLLEAGYSPDRIREFFTELEDQVNEVKDASYVRMYETEVDIRGLRFGDAARVGLLETDFVNEVESNTESVTLYDGAKAKLEEAFETLVAGIPEESIELRSVRTTIQGRSTGLEDATTNANLFLASHYIPDQLALLEEREAAAPEWTKENYMDFLSKENGSLVSLEEIAKVTREMSLDEVKQSLDSGPLGEAISELTKGTREAEIREDMVDLLDQKINDDDKEKTLQQALDNQEFTAAELASVRQEKQVELTNKITLDDVKAFKKGDKELTDLADLTGEQMTWMLTYAKEGQEGLDELKLSDKEREEFANLFDSDRAMRKMEDITFGSLLNRTEDFKAFKQENPQNKYSKRDDYTDLRLYEEREAMSNAEYNINQLYAAVDRDKPTRTDGSVMELNELPMAEYSGAIYAMDYQDLYEQLVTGVDGAGAYGVDAFIRKAQEFGFNFNREYGNDDASAEDQLTAALEQAAEGKSSRIPSIAQGAYDVYRAIAYEQAVERFNEDHALNPDAGPEVYNFAQVQPEAPEVLVEEVTSKEETKERKVGESELVDREGPDAGFGEDMFANGSLEEKIEEANSTLDNPQMAIEQIGLKGNLDDPNSDLAQLNYLIDLVRDGVNEVHFVEAGADGASYKTFTFPFEDRQVTLTIDADDATREQQIAEAFATDLGVQLVQERASDRTDRGKDTFQGATADERPPVRTAVAADNTEQPRTFDIRDQEAFKNVINNSVIVGVGASMDAQSANTLAELLNAAIDSTLPTDAKGNVTFDPDWKRAVQDYQFARGLADDGIVGHRTLAQMEFDDVKAVYDWAKEDGALSSDEITQLQNELQELQKAVSVDGNGGLKSKGEEALFNDTEKQMLEDIKTKLKESGVDGANDLVNTVTTISEEIRDKRGFESPGQ